MAGPKIPSGSLKGHASQAKKAARQGPFDITKSVVPKLDPKTFTGDDSESSSGSESGSSLSDMGTNNLSTADLRKRLYQQTPSKDKTNGTKDKDHAKFSKTATPAKSTTINGLKDSVKKQPSMVAIKQEDTSSSSESESESSSDEKAKKASAYGKVVEKSEPQSKSTSELESSSSSEDDSESESESEDEDEDNSEDTVQQIEQQMKNDVKTARSQSSQARAQSSSEEPSKKKAKRREPVSEDEDGDIDMMEESMALTNGGKSTNVGDVPEFVAPDFHLRKLDGDVDAADVAGFFSKAQLEGKQVWYITAPASLPVTVVQDLTIPLDQAQKGMTVLSHNGDDYRMAFDNPAASSSFRLIIPSKKGDVYSLLEQPINQTMHFTRSETFPPEGPASVTTTQTVSTTKPARPQPEGLRARYTPLGVPSPKPTITAPIPAKSKAVTKVAEQTVAASSPSKNKRKHRDDGEDGPAATASTPVHKKSGASGKKNAPAENSTKKQKTDNEASRKVTPIPPPRPGHGGGSRSTPIVSASQPAPRSRMSMSPGVGLPATQVTSAKQTPIPTLLSHHSADQSIHSEKMDKERKKAEKKAEKNRKRTEKEASKTVAHTAAKVTQVLPPQFDSRGVPLGQKTTR